MSETRPTKASAFYSLALSGLTLLGAAIVVELLSFLTGSILHRRWMTYGLLGGLRQQAIATSAPQLLDMPEGAPGQEMWISQVVAHPFVGAVLDRTFMPGIRQKRGGNDALEFGFSLIEPGLFHPPEPGVAVVALTGGSVTNLLANRSGNLLRAELARSLASRFRRIVLVNLALPGYKQPQQMMILAYLLTLGAHFDAVINLDGFNEVAMPPSLNARQGVFPFFPRTWFYHTKNFDPGMRTTIGELSYLRQRRAGLAQAFSSRTLRSSMTAGTFWTLLDRLLARQVASREVALQSWQSQSQSSFTVTGPHRTYRDEQALFADLVAVWGRSSLQMHRLCAENGIRYYHFLQPNQYVADSKPMGAAELSQAVNPAEAYRYYVAKGYPMLIAEGKRLAASGVRFADLTRVFSTVAAPVYVDTCCHFNELGDSLVNEAMVKVIVHDLH